MEAQTLCQPLAKTWANYAGTTIDRANSGQSLAYYLRAAWESVTPLVKGDRGHFMCRVLGFKRRVTIAVGKDHHCKNLPSSMTPVASCKVRRPSASISCAKSMGMSAELGHNEKSYALTLLPCYDGPASDKAESALQKNLPTNPASMISSALCLSAPFMPATACSKSCPAGTPQRSCITLKSKFCTSD